MYDSIAFLKTPTGVSYDIYGNERIKYADYPVYVQPRSVYSSEFYNAATVGLHPSITFDITNRADYHGEKLIEWDGKFYDVIRADWTAQRDRISLICEERIGAGVHQSQTPTTT